MPLKFQEFPKPERPLHCSHYPLFWLSLYISFPPESLGSFCKFEIPKGFKNYRNLRLWRIFCRKNALKNSIELLPKKNSTVHKISVMQDLKGHFTVAASLWFSLCIAVFLQILDNLGEFEIPRVHIPSRNYRNQTDSEDVPVKKKL